MSHGGAGVPQLSQEQREWLGLEEEDFVRILTKGGRTVVLERSRSDSALMASGCGSWDDC